MSLQNKLVLILAAVAVIYVTSDIALMRSMIAEPLRSLEEEEAVKDVERVRAGLRGVTSELHVRARTLANLSQSARFLTGEESVDFEQAVLGDDALRAYDLNLLYICDNEGGVRWGRIEQSSDRSVIRVHEFPADQLGDSHPVFLRRGKKTSSSGMLATDHGPMLVSSHKVTGPEGEVVGTVITGRFFDEELKARFLERARVEVDIWPLGGALPDQALALKDRITANSPAPVAGPEDEQTLNIYSTLENMLGSPELIMRARFDRSITQGGMQIVNFALLSSLATALLILLVLLRLLHYSVVLPLTRLTSHTAEIGRTEDMSARVAMDRGDEIGALSREFDGLMDKLAASRAQQISSSRLAGMSDIATGVLHNVGNILNSVNVSTSLARRMTEKLAVADLKAMAEVLDKHRDDLGEFVLTDPRGQQFLPFLDELTRTMSAQRHEILTELEKLGGGVEHIIELVRSQQSYAGLAGVKEPADVCSVVNSAVAICDQAIGYSGGVEVLREYESIPRVVIDKHKLMEILVNLIQNAHQVMDSSAAGSNSLTLRVKRDGDDQVRIEVQDTGPGIGVGDLTRVFSQGYTTRKGGHGIGLHISANAATEMGASLWAESEGLGKGATFILRLPAGRKETTKAA